MSSEESENIRAHRDLLAFARTTSSDLFALLSLTFRPADPSSPAPEAVKKAFRRAALLYHPDKNPDRQDWAAGQYDACTRARDVLLDDEARSIYEARKRGEAEKAAKTAKLEGERRRMVEELQRREAAMDQARREGHVGVGVGVKRGSDAEDEQESKVRRIAEEGRRRREERDRAEREKREAGKRRLTDENDEQSQGLHVGKKSEEIDRSVKVKWVKDSAKGNAAGGERLKVLFGSFGPVESVAMLKDKKARPSIGVSLAGEEKRPRKTEMSSALIVFETIVGAHAAVLDAPKLIANGADWAAFDSVAWASGQEPDLGFVRAQQHASTDEKGYSPSKRGTSTPQRPSTSGAGPRFTFTHQQTPTSHVDEGGISRVPSYGSFKKGGATSSPSLFESTMMRLREAERRKAEDAIRKAEE